MSNPEPHGLTPANDPSAVSAQDTPSYPQAATPDFDEATAAPGSTYQQQAYDSTAGTYQQQGYDQQGYAQQQAYAYAQPQPTYVAPTVQKQMIVAALLAFFLGYLGAHNFYLGNTTRGIIQLILTITLIGSFVSGIWAFVEFILILMRSGSYAYDAKGVPLA